MNREQALHEALRELVFMARTSGGTAGRDESLCAACDKAEAVLIAAPNLPQEQPAPPTVSVAVDRFLAWRLPATFSPDCGISFDGRKDDQWNKNKTWPIGTNLFTADEARAMFEHCLAGAQEQPTPPREPTREMLDVVDNVWGEHNFSDQELRAIWQAMYDAGRESEQPPKVGD